MRMNVASQAPLVGSLLLCGLVFLPLASITRGGPPDYASKSEVYYGAAFVSHVTPESIPVGTQFSVLGRGFGNEVGKVTLGGEECEVVEWADHAISARSPDAALIGKVEIVAGGKKLTGSIDVRVVVQSGLKLPSISEVTISKAPGNIAAGLAEVGDTLVVKGLGLGTTSGNAWLGEGWMATQPLPDAEATELAVTSWSDTTLELKLIAACKGQTRLRVGTERFLLLAPHGFECFEPLPEE